MDRENKIFTLYKTFILSNSKYYPQVFNDTPQKLADFPTITFIESDNRDSVNNNSTDRVEYVDELQFKVDIYTKNQKSKHTMIARKIITNELKNLTIEFFRKYGFRRTSCNKAEFLDIEVDRTVIVAECSINNWNGKIR